MNTSSTFNRLLEILPSEMRLVRRAKSGNVSAFVELCDPLVRHVYRYIHFLAPNNRVAEALTVQVFFKAWEHLDRYQVLDVSFRLWLYSIARKQVEEHIRTHRNNIPDNAVAIAARGGEFQQEFQIIREAIRSLPMDQQQVLVLKFIVCMPEKDIAYFLSKSRKNIRDLQVAGLCTLSSRLGRTAELTVASAVRRILESCLVEISNGASTLEDCLLRHFKAAPQLEPLLKTALLLQLGRDVTPPSSFNSYTHDALVQYLRTRPRQGMVIPAAAVRRAVIALSIVVTASFVTGTAYAQSALPGQTFYGWKRASETVLIALSPNPVSTNLFLAERRLKEWVAVENDPTLSVAAQTEYQNSIQRLQAVSNEGEEFETVAAALQSQQEELADAGLESPALNEYLLQVSTLDHVQPQATPAVVFPIATGTPTVAPTDAADIECDTPNCKNNGKGPGNNNAGGIGNGPGSNNSGGVGNGSNGNNNSGGGGNDGEKKDNNGGGNDIPKDNKGGGN